MKKISALLLVVMMCLVLCGCCLKHDMTPATCTEPSTCTKCGKTYCIEDTSIPIVSLPQGFIADDYEYIVKAEYRDYKVHTTENYEIGKVFRNGPVKLGRCREFYQCDIDLVGIDGTDIEVEQMTLFDF